MTHDVETIAEYIARPPEQGRIRFGEKHGNAMRHIETLRFTAPDRDVIAQIAAAYGGRVTQWDDPKASPSRQWQVVTAVKQCDVLLPPGGFSQWMEYWGGKGCERRCDGTSMVIPTGKSCMCKAAGVLACKPYTRVNLLLPNFTFGGTWRFDTKGGQAAKELKWMTELLQAMSVTGQPVLCTLRVEVRNSWAGGQKRNYVVPRIELKHTLVEIMEGKGTMAELGRTDGPLLALPTGDEVIEAEVVERTPEVIAKAHAADDETLDKINELAAQVLAKYPGKHQTDDSLIQALVFSLSKGRLNHIEDVSQAGRIRIERDLAKILRGQLEVP